MTVDSIDHLAPRVPKSDFDALFVPRVAWKLALKRASGDPKPRLSRIEMRCTAFEVRCIWFVRCLREKTLRRRQTRRAAHAKARRYRRRQKRRAKLRFRHRETIDELLARSKTWFQSAFVRSGGSDPFKEVKPSSDQASAAVTGCESSPVNPSDIDTRLDEVSAAMARVEGSSYSTPRSGASNIDLIRSFYSISDGSKVADLVTWTRLLSESEEILSNAYGETIPNKAAERLVSQGYAIALAVVDSRLEFQTPFLEWGSLARMWLDCFLRSGHPGFWQKYVFCLSHRTLVSFRFPDGQVFATYPNTSETVRLLHEARYFEAHRVRRVGEEVLIASLELRFRQSRDWGRRFSS